jgi:predicted AlkP superfamily phosphohydrolase/phosphomutase
MVRSLFIGLDGATFTLLDELTRELPGEGVTMPTLGRLMREGYRSRLRSTALPLTPPAWVSLMTGRTPGHHGVLDFVRFEDRGSDFYWTLYDARDIRVETIWQIASRQARSVVALNFPMMAPPSPVNGSLIAGFVSWKHLRRSMTPASLFDRVKEIPGFSAQELAWDFQRESKIGEEMTAAELEAWVHHHRPREEQWFRIAEMLLRDDNPDLFAVMFDGTDKLQHQLWHVLDPRLRPERPSEEYTKLRRLVLGYYRRLDEYIARLVELAGPQAQVFFASDHGFTATFDVVRINRYLGEKGYLTWAQSDGSAASQRREDANFAHLDWAKTTAFCPTPSSNGICIRVAREPGQPGIPADQYLAFRDRLMRDLYELRAPDGGQVITEIMTREEAFPGAAMGAAPDLTLTLRDHGFVSVRNRAPVVEARSFPAGTHHPDGIFIASGPGIAAYHEPDLMQIIDVTPTLLYSLDLPVPENFEGRIPERLFTRETLVHQPVRVGPPTLPVGTQPAATAPEASDAEREKILDQLRALGYLEDQ